VQQLTPQTNECLKMIVSFGLLLFVVSECADSLVSHCTGSSKSWNDAVEPKSDDGHKIVSKGFCLLVCHIEIMRFLSIGNATR